MPQTSTSPGARATAGAGHLSPVRPPAKDARAERAAAEGADAEANATFDLSLIHISEPTRLALI
eukprot:9289253-Alexandrium_andersonii.AAC.1